MAFPISYRGELRFICDDDEVTAAKVAEGLVAWLKERGGTWIRCAGHEVRFRGGFLSRPRWMSVIRNVSHGVIVVRRDLEAVSIEYRIFMYDEPVICVVAMVFWNAVAISNHLLTFEMEVMMIILCLLVLAMGYAFGVGFFPGRMRNAVARVIQRAAVKG